MSVPPTDGDNRIRVANAFERLSLSNLTENQEIVQLDSYELYVWTSLDGWVNLGEFKDFTPTDKNKLDELYTASRYPRTGSDYIQLDTVGRPQLIGSNAVWDEMPVALNTTDKGNKPPLLQLLKNDGQAVPGTAKALKLSPTSQASLTDNGALDFSAPYTIEFWVKPSSETAGWEYFIRKVGCFGIRTDNSRRLRVGIDGYANLTSTNFLMLDTWNHVALTVYDTIGGNDELKLYLNGVLEDSLLSQWGDLTDNTNPVVLNPDYTTFEIDELAIWNKVLTDTEIANRYDNGSGVALAGGETDLQGAWGFEEGSGTTVGDKTPNNNPFNISGTGYAWTDGWIGASVQGTVGVYVWHFNTGEINEVFFTLQLPHTYKEGTDLRPHVHWIKHTADSGSVLWGLEYTIANVAGAFSDTTVLTTSSVDVGNPSTPYSHLLSNLGTIPGSGLTISSILVGRLFRRGNSPSDTLDTYAALLEFDIHFMRDTLGSRTELTK